MQTQEAPLATHVHRYHPESGWCIGCGTARIDRRLMTQAGQEVRPGTGPDWRAAPPAETLFDPATGEIHYA